MLPFQMKERGSKTYSEASLYYSLKINCLLYSNFVGGVVNFHNIETGSETG